MEWVTWISFPTLGLGEIPWGFPAEMEAVGHRVLGGIMASRSSESFTDVLGFAARKRNRKNHREQLNRAVGTIVESLEQRLMLTIAAPTSLLASPDSSP